MSFWALLWEHLREEGTIIWVASLPVVELRGAIPLAVAMGMEPVEALVFAVLGNMLPVPFILRFLEPVSSHLRRTRPMRALIEWVLARGEKKSGSVRRYGLVGLALFVAVPLPGTGAWTGAVIASLLGYRFWPAFWALLGGTVGAGIIVTTLVLMGKAAWL